MLEIERMKEETKDTDYPRPYHLVGSGPKFGVSRPLRRIQASDSVVARNIGASTQRPRRIKKLRRLRGEEVVALIMRFVDSSLPGARLAGLTSLGKAVETKGPQRPRSVFEAGRISGLLNRLHNLSARLFGRISRSAHRLHCRSRVDVLEKPALVPRTQQ